ncbi:helix-turn-helix domain-containing protein [Ilumatobacter sp.]|uniref:helix-turn-helix domain-containing protein n=1 Tax=Ilumatobacter sp. TaxID=1967498 RepID=UPI003B523B2E
MNVVMAGILTHGQKQLAFRLRARGLRLVDIAREVGCTAQMVALVVRDELFTTGISDPSQPRPGCLGIADREEILVGVKVGDSLTAIAQRLGRAPLTVSRKIAANGGRDGYSAWAAHQRAQRQSRRPKPCKLCSGPLRNEVARRLE